LPSPAGLAGGAHRGVALQHIGGGDGLLVLHQGRGIVADAEWRVHQVLVAQQANPAATGNLATTVGSGQIPGAHFGGIDGGLRQRQLTVADAFLQGKAAIFPWDQIQAAAGQQPVERFMGGELAGQAGAVQPLREGRLE
jgi:hypothetical protein